MARPRDPPVFTMRLLSDMRAVRIVPRGRSQPQGLARGPAGTSSPACSLPMVAQTMAYDNYTTGRRGRIAAMLAAGAINLGLVLGLIHGLDANIVGKTVQAISAFNVPLPSPSPSPPPSPEPVAKAHEPAAAAAPPAAKARPKEIVAPKPPLAIPRETVKAPPVASSGDATRVGAAEAGPGTGAGGRGVGTGAAGSGTGSGGGRARRAEKIAGEISPRDYPAAMREARIGKFVVISYLVGIDGRVTDCRVVQPSGVPEADAVTCRLAVQRHRYRPALDASGEPVAVRTGWKQWWYR